MSRVTLTGTEDSEQPGFGRWMHPPGQGGIGMGKTDGTAVADQHQRATFKRAPVITIWNFNAAPGQRPGSDDG